MTVALPLIAIIGAIAFVAYRYMGLRIWHAVVCLLFGFLLAATSAAPQIHQLMAAVVGWLTGSHP